MKRQSMIILGIMGVLFGTMMILPALAQHKQHPEAWTSNELKGLFIGIVIAIGGVSTTFYGIKKQLQPGKKFTLVDLLMTIVIVGILAAVLLPLL